MFPMQAESRLHSVDEFRARRAPPLSLHSEDGRDSRHATGRATSSSWAVAFSSRCVLNAQTCSIALLPRVAANGRRLRSPGWLRGAIQKLDMSAGEPVLCV